MSNHCDVMVTGTGDSECGGSGAVPEEWPGQECYHHGWSGHFNLSWLVLFINIV